MIDPSGKSSSSLADTIEHSMTRIYKKLKIFDDTSENVFAEEKHISKPKFRWWRNKFYTPHLNEGNYKITLQGDLHTGMR